TATPCMPLWPSQKKSAATTLEPAVPNRRTILPEAWRTESPRQRSVKNMAPSVVKARSQGFSRPVKKSVRVIVGASVDGGLPEEPSFLGVLADSKPSVQF